MTKKELRIELEKGRHLDEILPFTDGQECLIFKADSFSSGEEIVYIPDIYLNEIHVRNDLTARMPIYDDLGRISRFASKDEQINDVLSYCYTGTDFIQEAGGDEDLALRLFFYVDWQHPSSAIPEITEEENDTQE